MLKKIGKTGTIKFLFNLKFWRLFKKPPCANEFSLDQVLFCFLLYKTFFLNEVVNCNAPFPWDSFPWSIQYQPWLAATLEKKFLVQFHLLFLSFLIETVLKFFLVCRIFVNDQQQNEQYWNQKLKEKNLYRKWIFLLEKEQRQFHFFSI